MSISLISGRIKTVPPLSVDGGRYNFIGPGQAEPNLGVPDAIPYNAGHVLTTNLTGGRFWYDATKWDSVYNTTQTYSGDWNSTYTTLCTFSATWLTQSQADALYLKLSGGELSGGLRISTGGIYVSGDGVFDGNLTVTGNLTVIGGVSSVVTRFNINSSISAINYGPAPAMYVYQNPYYGNPNDEVIVVQDLNKNPLIYVKQQNVSLFTEDFSERVTINGNVSTNGLLTVDSLYARGINVTGLTAFSGDLNITGSITAGGGMLVGGDLLVNGAISGSSIDINSNIYSTGNLTVAGSASVGTHLEVGQDVSTGSNLNVGGSATVFGDFNITQGQYFSAGIALFDLFANNDDVRKGVLAYANLSANSGYWDSAYNSVNANSGRYESVYTNVNENSAFWWSVYNQVSGLSSFWSSVYTSIADNSARYDSTYTTVLEYSASWAGLTTSLNYLSTNNVLISAASVTEFLSSRKFMYADVRILSAGVASSNNAAGLNGTQYVQNQYVFVSQYDAPDYKLVIFDISNVSEPVQVYNGTIGTDQILKIVVEGNKAYILTTAAILTYDVTDKKQPHLASTYTTTQNNFVANGNYLYAIETSGGTLSIIDVANPSQFNVLNVLTTDSTGNNPAPITYRNGYVYLPAHVTSKLNVYNVIDPVNVTATSVDIISQPNDINVQERYIYIAGSADLGIYDTQNAYAPVNAIYNIGSNINISIQNRYLYALDSSNNQLSIYNLVNPSSAMYVDAIITPYAPTGLSIVGRTVIVTTPNDNKIVAYDLGGLYAQQLEAGGAQLGWLNVINDASLAGKLQCLVLASEPQANPHCQVISLQQISM